MEKFRRPVSDRGLTDLVGPPAGAVVPNRSVWSCLELLGGQHLAWNKVMSRPGMEQSGVPPQAMGMDQQEQI